MRVCVCVCVCTYVYTHDVHASYTHDVVGYRMSQVNPHADILLWYILCGCLWCIVCGCLSYIYIYIVYQCVCLLYIPTQIYCSCIYILLLYIWRATHRVIISFHSIYCVLYMGHVSVMSHVSYMYESCRIQCVLHIGLSYHTILSIACCIYRVYNTMWISILCTYADMLLLYILGAYIYMVYNVVVYDECLESGWGRALYAMLLSSIHLWNVLVYSTIS
jgi:hypothetical protein